MANMFIARSLVFYPGYFSDNCQELSDEIIIPSYHLNKLMEKFQDNEPLLVNLTNVEKKLSIVVSIGTPHTHDKNTIFVPQWILDLIELEGNSNSPISIKKTHLDIPIATKIVIKPLDPIAFELDTLACFEKTLMNLHTIKEGITIPVHIPEIGKDYTMFAYIEKVEPQGLSRIVNGEVDVEFINEFQDFTPVEPQNTIINSSTSNGNSSDRINQFESMIPELNLPSKREQPPPDRDDLEERRKKVRESWLKRFEST